MASGKLNLYSNSGKILTVSVPDDLARVADAVNNNHALSKYNLELI